MNELKEMYRKHRMLWDSISIYGGKKGDQPVWKKNGGSLDDDVKDRCFCCQWVEDRHSVVSMGTCKYCPLGLDCGDHSSLYKKWINCNDKHSEEAKQLAARIRDMPLIEHKEEKKYKIGQRFVAAVSKYEYILVDASGLQVSLIRLATGNRWNDSISVKDVENITEEEFKRISDGNFTPIEDNR